MKIDKMKIGKSLVVITILFGTCLISGNTVSSTVDAEQITKNIGNINIGDEGTEYWALLVAVGVYADDPQQNRPLMLEEIDDLYDLLIESDVLSEDHIRLIKAEDGTVGNIISGFKWLDQMEDEDDISLVYLTTHGAPLGFDIPPLDEADETDEALLSYWSFAYESQFIYDDQINYRLNTLESKGVCMIVDSCYAGGFNDDPNRIKNKLTSMTVKDWIIGFGEELSGQNRVVLMASREDEVSYSGGFAPYLIDGFRGYADINSDDIVTAEEAFYYAQPRASHQHPTIFDNYPDELPIIYLNDAIKDSEFEPENTEKENIATIQSEVRFQENSVINGFVKDADTDDPVEDAIVYIRGRAHEWEFFENETTTDSNGFYSFNVPPCTGRISVYADGYCSSESVRVEVGENEILWVNITMYPRPQENSMVYGYITNDDTGNPIAGADIELDWEGDQEQSYRNETVSDQSGFYSMNVAAGVIDLDVEAIGYFPEHMDGITISDYESIQLDFSLVYRSGETSVLCGFITDKDTGTPINDARVTIEWVDIELGHGYENDTATDVSGFYSINIPPGELYVDIRKTGYECYDPYRHDNDENDVIWFNTSLEGETIEVDFAKPLRAFYIYNNRLFPYNKARIIGKIDIEVFVYEDWWGHGSAEKVEFYIDGELKSTVYSEPYLWTWNEIKFGTYTIKAIAYDDEGNTATKEIEVYKFL